MGIYRILWRIVVGVLTVGGASLAFLYVPWGFVISISVCALILGPLIGAGIRSHTRGSAGPTLRSSIITAALAVVGVLAVSGLIALFDAAALLVVGLLAVSSPPVLRRILPRSPQLPRPGQQPNPPRVAPPSRLSSQAPASPEPAPIPPPARPRSPSCHSLSDAELCWRWRTSFTALRRTVSPGERLRLITTRSELLDELARRDRAGFQRWLDSGARAASDPARFLTHLHHTPHVPGQHREP